METELLVYKGTGYNYKYNTKMTNKSLVIIEQLNDKAHLFSHVDGLLQSNLVGKLQPYDCHVKHYSKCADYLLCVVKAGWVKENIRCCICASECMYVWSSYIHTNAYKQ